jgi:MFS family permease
MEKTSNIGTPLGRPRVFYGHWLVLVTFIFNFMAIGCGSFAFSLFVTPLQDAFGWGRGQIMAGFTIFFVTMGVTCPVVGRFVDRYGARPVIPIGAVVMGLGFVVVSQMSQLSIFYLGYVLVGAGAAGMGQVPSSAVVSNWFKKRRGTAIGLMAAGVGAAFPSACWSFVHGRRRWGCIPMEPAGLQVWRRGLRPQWRRCPVSRSDRRLARRCSGSSCCRSCSEASAAWA